MVTDASDMDQVRALLCDRFSPDIRDLEPLPGGEFSRAFAFISDGASLVIRLNTAAHGYDGYAKDDYAWRHFASPDLPIPRSVAYGELDRGSFAISERVPGKTLVQCTPDERRAVLPSLLDTLDAIGRADLDTSHGYGLWHGDGHGEYARWRDYLAAIIDNERDGYYRDWHALFRDSFLEREVYELVYRRLLRLAEHCPEERALIHNDYWFMNLLADSGRISGVIDWANALYGDPVYEIARLAWGADWPGWWYADGAAILRARYGALPGYTERAACYECHFGLDDLRFYAKTGRRAEYTWARDRLLALAATD